MTPAPTWSPKWPFDQHQPQKPRSVTEFTKLAGPVPVVSGRLAMYAKAVMAPSKPETRLQYRSREEHRRVSLFTLTFQFMGIAPGCELYTA
jgi:hypothetical protein